MKKVLALSILAIAALYAISFAQAAKYKKMNANGSANIIFSTVKISKNEESKSPLKTTFSNSETIFARAYFPGAFGTLEGEAEGFIDMWVDGKHAKRLGFSNKDVPAGNDQMLIYVHNTGSDDFKDEVWNEISAGKHTIKIVVGKTQFLKKKVVVDVEGEDLVAKRDDAYKAVYLSESDFTFVKD